MAVRRQRALAGGTYEVTYNPLSKMGTLHVVIYALDQSGTVLATNAGIAAMVMASNGLMSASPSAWQSSGVAAAVPGLPPPRGPRA